MKRMAWLAAAVLLLGMLSGCGKKQYSVTYFDLFDTVTTVVGRGRSEAAFQQQAQAIHDQLLRYHQLFDIYQEYPGITNLKTVNDRAAQGPVVVDATIMALLRESRRYYDLTGGKVNVAMGSVLQLWHAARTHGLEDPAHAALPEQAALEEGALHTDMEKLILDTEASTVFFADPGMRLDVGAVAKGWACQQVARNAPEGLLITVGGNVCATGPKDEKGTVWTVGVQDPNGGSGYLRTLGIAQGSLVTSGDYQRVYRVGDRDYHHIIDPDTLFPGTLWRSVTVASPDSGLADALSTALFLMPLEQGMALLEALDAEAMWADARGQVFFSPDFETLLQ